MYELVLTKKQKTAMNIFGFVARSLVICDLNEANKRKHLHKSIYKFTENAKHIAELMSSQYSLYNRWLYFLAGLKYKCSTNPRNKTKKYTRKLYTNQRTT